jgi:MoaA/NifB/PqqE/SkfB family radical SAM enzyme
MPDEEEVMLTKALRVATTYRCPLNCPICYAGDEPEEDMGDELFRFLLEEGRGLGFESVALGGGEPLANRAQILRLLDMSKGEGYLTAVTTSGYNLDGEYLAELAGAGLDHLQLSLGYNRTNFPGLLDLLDGNREAEWGINFLVDPRRVGELPTVHGALAETDCEYIVYLVPRVGDSFRQLRFTYEQAIRYILALSEIKRESGKLALVGCATNYLRNQTCAGLEKGLSVSADGRLSMCGYCDRWVELGDSLGESMELFEREHHTGECVISNMYMRSSGRIPEVAGHPEENKKAPVE